MVRLIVRILRILALPLRPLRPLTRAIGAALRDLWHEWAGPQAQRRREAQRTVRTLLHELSRLGFTRTVTTGHGRKARRRRSRVQLEGPLLLTHDELWLPLRLSHLPRGITTDDLRQEPILKSLEDRLNRPVRLETLITGKLCFVVGMRGSKFPEKYSINAATIPADAPPMVVPFGLNGDGEPVLVDLLDLKHLLVAGATGGGKTTLHHSILQTLISRNTAEDIELWLVDLKKTEFNLYRPLTGRRGEGGIVRRIAVDEHEALDLLSDARRELDERNKLMAFHRCTSLDDLARSRGVKLKRIVLIIDEFALLTTSLEKIGKQNLGTVAKTLMGQLASVGRSGGMSIIIATQAVNKDIVDSFIRANFENRICFSTADWRQSQLIIESSEADGIPEGRAFLRKEGKTMEVQTCYITPRQVRIEVDRIAEYGPDGAWGIASEHTRFVKDAKLLIAAASQHLNGDLTRAKVLALDGVKGVISRERFDEIMRRLEHDGVVVAGGKNKARRVAVGFFNRPGLLDALYGSIPTSASQPDPNGGPDRDWDGVGMDGAPRPDAPDGAAADSAQLGVGMDETAPIAMDTEEENEPPTPFKGAIIALEQEGVDLILPPEPEQPKKPKSRKKPPNTGE